MSSTYFVDSPISAALWIVLRASVLLAVAALVQLVLHRRVSAATRHLVWTLAMGMVLLLPAASLVAPEWAVVVSTQPAVVDAPPIATSAEAATSEPLPAAPASISRSSPAPAAPADMSASTVAIAVYAAIALVILLRLLLQRWHVGRIAHRATVVRDPEWMQLLDTAARSLGVGRSIRLVQSREHNIPMTFGTRRPSIVIPTVAGSWPEDRRRAVVLHEVAHVARHDCLTQPLALAACAMFWFHPATWWIARRLRIERELACDDRVIAAGTEGRDYAGHLLEIAYSFGGHRAPALAVSMARPHQLEGRMLAALDAARNRSVPAPRVRLGGAMIAIALLVTLAGAKPTAVTITRAEDGVATVWAPPAAHDQDRIGPHLKAIDTPVHEFVRDLVRLASASVGFTQEAAPGTWEIRTTNTDGTVHLRLVELNSSSGTNVPLAQLEGLTSAQLTGAGGPVQFRLRRDAGTFTFEGVIRNGVGAGTFSFAPDPKFPDELAKRGFARPSAREQYQLARHDVGFAFVDELNTQGYAKPQTADLVRAGQHGVQVTYLREMGALGFRFKELDPLITLRDHGVTPGYVRELGELGYKGLSADEVRRTRDHGVTAEYVRAMRDGGYGQIPLPALVNARDHGITPEYVRALSEAGYRNLPLDQLINVRDHGVTPEYVRDMRQLGHTLPIDELVRARDHGITVEYVRAMAALGYDKQPMAMLIKVRDHGVTPEYATELKGLGYDPLALDDLVMLRDHGLTAERIRKANSRAGTKLPLDLLKSIASGGGL